MCADVVIVGGGPVGCWTAIQIKKRNPGLEVQVYERYPEYQRDHMMSIRKESLEHYSKRTGDALEQELYAKIAGAHSTALDTTAQTTLPPVTHIRTLELESILKDHCEKQGIRIAYEAMESPQQVMDRHPECRNFVAADGAHSKMRTALLGEDGVYKRDLLSSVDVKYKARGQAKYMREPTVDKIDTIVVETVGKQENGQTDVALRLLVDDRTFDNLPPMTFKNPLNMKSLRSLSQWNAAAIAGRNVANKIEDFQILRKKFANEEIIPGTEVITKIRLSQYASKKFAVTMDHENRRAAWFMVGDAAMGLPFYRSVNAGLRLGSQLGAVLGSTALSSPDMKAKAYSALRPLNVGREFGMVAAKLSGLKFYQKAVRPTLQGMAIGAAAVVLVPVAVVYAPIAAVALMINPRARLM